MDLSFGAEVDNSLKSFSWVVPTQWIVRIANYHSLDEIWCRKEGLRIMADALYTEEVLMRHPNNDSFGIVMNRYAKVEARPIWCRN